MPRISTIGRRPQKPPVWPSACASRRAPSSVNPGASFLFPPSPALSGGRRRPAATAKADAEPWRRPGRRAGPRHSRTVVPKATIAVYVVACRCRTGEGHCPKTSGIPGATAQHALCRPSPVTVRSRQSRVMLDPEVLLMRTAPVVAAALVLSALAGTAAAQTPFVPYFGKNNHPLRRFRVVHLHDRPLRDLLLPRDREAPGARRQLRGERVSAGQRRPAPRPVVQGADDPVQDAQRVRAAERHSGRRAGRRRRVRRAVPASHAAAARRPARPPLRPRSSTS